MIYIASPYSHPDKYIREHRYVLVLTYTHLCMKQDEIVFSPIAYGHEFMRFGEEYMPSDRLRVFKIEGWDKSVGVREEIQFAEHLNIPVEYANAYGMLE